MAEALIARRMILLCLEECMEKLEMLKDELQLDPLTVQPDEAILDLAFAGLTTAHEHLLWIDHRRIRAEVEAEEKKEPR